MTSKRRRFILPLPALLLCVASLAPITAQTRTNQPPKLAVVIVVDQMRPDYLSRYEKLFTGGFKRLLEHGFAFTDAHHDHAVTETGVGHATISTGSCPSHHGIVSNAWWDRTAGKMIYCVEDSTANIAGYPGSKGRSPAKLMRLGIGDWLKRASPESKVCAIAGKDRAAILTGAFEADLVYWYNGSDGKFVTSIYYSPIYPAWIDSFNNALPADDYFSGIWDRLLPKDAYSISGADSCGTENDGVDITFPHSFAPTGAESPSEYYSNLRATPFADQLSFRFAHDLIANERLGADSIPDLLFVSCSAADYVGHAFGAFSHEVQDYYLRLDQYLNQFLAYLDSTVGAESYVTVLCADHAGMPLPEHLLKQGLPAGRIDPDTLEDAVKRVGAEIARELQLSQNVVLACSDGVILDYSEASFKGVSESRLREMVADKVRLLSFVADVYTSDELRSGAGVRRKYLEQFRNNFNAERSPDVMLRLKEYWIIDDDQYGTTHGSCYSYDTHVPLIFSGAGIAAGRYDQRVTTVDIAPTIAELLGLTPPQNIDGKSLRPLLPPQ